MSKSTRIVKRLIALSLVLLLSIESCAAVVGDNDGAAFITKAEFDSMKNDFQSQLDRYNSSIDNKIDGAIASYLAGVNVVKQEELVNYYEDFIRQNCMDYRDIKWSASATRACDASVDVALYKELLSNIFGATKTISGSGKTYFPLNIYLFGESSITGTDITLPELYESGFDGWIRSRWDLSGTVTGITVNRGFSVTIERDMSGFFALYNARGVGTKTFYHQQGSAVDSDGSYQYMYGNGLVASVDKTYFDREKNAFSRIKPNTKEYVFAPWAATSFAYEDFVDPAYTWTSPSTETWNFQASGARVHELVDGLPSNELNDAIRVEMKAKNVKKLQLKSWTLNSLSIMDWKQKYGWNGNIKAGVPLSVAPADGDLEIEYQVSSGGWLVAFNPVSATDYTWGGARLNSNDNSSFKIDKYAVSTTSNKIKIENLQKGLICFVFVPNSSDDQFINITKVSYIRD